MLTTLPLKCRRIQFSPFLTHRSIIQKTINPVNYREEIKSAYFDKPEIESNPTLVINQTNSALENLIHQGVCSFFRFFSVLKYNCIGFFQS
jgi:hypothetical protein